MAWQITLFLFSMTSVLWVGVQYENGTHPLEFQLNQGLPIILGICGNHLNHYLITTYSNFSVVCFAVSCLRKLGNGTCLYHCIN